MDSHHLSRQGVPGPDAPIKLAAMISSAYAGRTNPLQFALSNSPDSPLCGHFELDTFSALGKIQQEHHGSTDTVISFSPVKFQEAAHVRSPDLPPMDERNALQEIETILLGPDSDGATASSCPDQYDDRSSCVVTSKYQKVSNGELYPAEKRQRILQADAKEVHFPRGDVKHLLLACAEALSDDRTDDFHALVRETQKVVNVSGSPDQRLGAYMLEGLVARQEASGSTIYSSLRHYGKQPEGRDLLSYMRILYDVCPYFKFGYMAANGAIAEAVRSEDRVHIVDFKIAQGTQWVTLIQALAARPGGPPQLRITGIDDPVSRYARGRDLRAVGERLDVMSKRFRIPLEFRPISVASAAEVTREMLDVRPGEALAVNFTLQLHRTPDESVDVNNPRDGLLRMVKGLSPRVTTLVEQESNTNTTPFLTRFAEALDYYSAMFESIDATLPRASRERVSVEQHCLAKDIVNVVACEGKERVERHELLGKWRSRLGMAGFKPYPLSSYVNSVIRRLLKSYSDKYTLVEKDGATLLGWKDRDLISASAWH